MRRVTVIVSILTGFLCYLPQFTHSQRKPSRRVPQDEILFDQADYVRITERGGWRLIARTSPSSEGQLSIFYDRARVSPPFRPRWLDPDSSLPPFDGIRQVWIRTEKSVDRIVESYWIDLNEYDCGQNLARVMESHHYSNDGNPMNSLNESQKWQRIIPESIHDSVFGVACLNKPDSEKAEMEAAAGWFKEGRRAEKRNDPLEAQSFYGFALERAPGNRKILDGLNRVRARIKSRHL